MLVLSRRQLCRLYPCQVRALNEQTEGSVKTVLKPWDQRLNFETILESNPDDPELLIFIP